MLKFTSLGAVAFKRCPTDICQQLLLGIERGNQAARAIDQPGLPPARRDLISGYFDRLSRATAGG